MVQHIAASHNPISDCTCPNHHNADQHGMSNGVQGQHSLRWWQRHKVGTAVRKCFKLRQTAPEEPCPVHHNLGEPSELAGASVTARFDSTCDGRCEIGSSALELHMADSNTVFEIGSPVDGGIYEIGGRSRYELPAESVPPTYPTTTYQPVNHPAYTDHPPNIDAEPITIDETLGPHSPVSPLSPNINGSISSFAFTGRPLVFDHSAAGAPENTVSQGLVATSHDVVMSDGFDPSTCDPYNSASVDEQTESDSQARLANPQAPYDPYLETPEDLACLRHLVSTVTLARFKIEHELIDNSVVAFDVIQDALRHDEGFWLRKYATPFSSPSSLLKKCLQAVQKVILHSPPTDKDMFHLKYLAAAAARIPRGFCVWERERDLSASAEASVCFEGVWDVCIRSIDRKSDPVTQCHLILIIIGSHVLLRKYSSAVGWPPEYYTPCVSTSIVCQGDHLASLAPRAWDGCL
jgi:hypothetical protein